MNISVISVALEI